jgi:hypothetical protein
MADLLTGRGVTIELDQGDMITDVVVLARISRTDGSTTLGLAISEGTSWLDQYGLVKAAGNVLDSAGWDSDDT